VERRGGMDRRVDVALALALAALGLFIIVTAQFIGRSPVPDPIGPRGIPTGLGVAFFIGGVGLAARRVVRWGRETTYVEPEGTEDDPGVPPGSARRAMLMWLTALGYVLALPILGHPIATPVALMIMLRLLEFRRPPILGVPALVAYPVIFTAVAYTVFAVLLGIRLPLGIIREIFLRLTGQL
jgi:hypothetical protein